MRHIAALLGVLSLTACDSLWRWTARCDVGDSACAPGTTGADMSVYPLADLANADLLGVDLTNYPAPAEDWYSVALATDLTPRLYLGSAKSAVFSLAGSSKTSFYKTAELPEQKVRGLVYNLATRTFAGVKDGGIFFQLNSSGQETVTPTNSPNVQWSGLYLMETAPTTGYIVGSQAADFSTSRDGVLMGINGTGLYTLPDYMLQFMLQQHPLRGVSGVSKTVVTMGLDLGPVTTSVTAAAVGDKGTIFELMGSTWTLITTDALTTYNAVHFSADDMSYWAVGSNGTSGFVTQRAGLSGLTTPSSGTVSKPLNGVWAASQSDAWVVGDGGTLLRCSTPITCIAVTIDSGPVTANLQAVWGTNKNAQLELYAVGLGGVVLRSTNGSNWSKIAN